MILEAAQSVLGKRGGAARLRQLGYDPDSLPTALLGKNGPMVLVARDDEEVSGFATLALGRARLEMIFVEPGHRRRGIGTALVHAAVERTQARGGPSLSVVVAAGNRGEKSLFEALGYRAELLVMERRDHSKPPAS